MSVQQNKLKAIADAIREKDGTTDPIPANDFPDRIRAIPSGVVPEGVYTITLETSDPEGGTVTGGGLVQEGMTVTITAAPGDGYKFTGWQENGVIVSEDEAYTFTVTRDWALTAVFAVYRPSRLPDGYTEVEYISLDNSVILYSALNFFTLTTRIIMNIVPKESFSNDRCLFYAQGTGSYPPIGRLSTKKCGLGYWTSSLYLNGDTSYTCAPEVGKALTIDMNAPGKTLTIGNESFALHPYNRNQNAGNTLIGGRPYSTSYQCEAPTLSMDLYSMQLYREGVLFGDFVPCVNSEGVVGMYNISTENIATRFVYASEGTITPGPAV